MPERRRPPGLSEANQFPVDRQRRLQSQRTRSVSPGRGSWHHNEVIGNNSTNATRTGTAPPHLSAQSPRSRNDSADHTLPSYYESVNPALGTDTPEDEPDRVNDFITSASKAIKTTDKPLSRKRDEDSDADALPTKRTKTGHASGSSDDHDRPENKNDAPLGSPVQNDGHITVPTSTHAESTFDRDISHASKGTNKPVSIPPRDLVQELYDGILPEEAEAAIAASKPHDGPGYNSLGAWQAQEAEAEAETESQQLEPSLSINKQPEGSYVHRDTVVSSSHEATAQQSTSNNNDQAQKALEALQYLENPEVQKYLAASHGKRALQVSRGLAEKKFAQDAVNKYNPRDGWRLDNRASRAAGASESGLVIEFDMPVNRADRSSPDPNSPRWIPAPGPDGAAVMYKRSIGLVTTNDEEFKNVKVFTTKSNTDPESLRRSGKLRHYAQIIRSPQEARVKREEGVYCHLEIVCDAIDDINLNITGPRLMATMTSYQHPHGTPYRVVGHLKDRADMELFCSIQKMAAAVAVEQSHASFDRRRTGWFERYRNTHATAGDNSTAVSQVCCSLLHRITFDRLTIFRHVFYLRRTAMRQTCLLTMFLDEAKSARIACTCDAT